MGKSKKTILLVDNNPETLRLEVDFLQDSNFPPVSYNVITASDEKGAAEKIEQHNGDLVVVVPNNLVETEENSGIKLIENLRKEHPKTPFVLVKLGHNNDVGLVEKLLKSNGLDVPYVEDGDEQLVNAIKEGFKKLEKKTILVVDDSKLVLDSTVKLYKEIFPYAEIVTAGGKHEAEEIIKRYEGNLVVVTDNDMPEVKYGEGDQGIALIGSIVQKYPQTPCMLVTLTPTEDIRDKLDKVGAEYIKYFEKGALKEIDFIKEGFAKLAEYNKTRIDMQTR